MKAIRCLLLAGLLGTMAMPSAAQIVYYNVQRQKWMAQYSTNPVPLLYRFASLAAAPTYSTIPIISADVRSPKVAHAFVPGALMSFGTNISAWVVSGTNVASGLDIYTTNYPLGTYQVYDQYKPPIGQPKTQTFQTLLTNDFPALDPIITNVSPLNVLQATQTFVWPAFSQDPECFTRFYLLEGNIETNILQSIVDNGITSVTNDMVILSWQLKLPATQNSITVSNVNPAMDHLAILEFHNVSPALGTSLPSEAASVSVGATFYFSLRVLVHPASQAVVLGQPATLTSYAVGVKPISYQWKFQGTNLPGATNWFYTISDFASNNVGSYYVAVSNAAGTENSLTAELTVATNTVSGDSLTISDVARSGMSLQFRVDSTYLACFVQASTNLVDWEDLRPLAVPAGTAVFVDTNVISRRSLLFYRVRKAD